jgi:prepilin-type N-terminal cleavage/methylation domain-containing protein
MTRALPHFLFRKGSRLGRGFTLIELMVALSIGLSFSVMVFMLTRDASRFFQRESRVADATLGAIIGFERLKADITRAGFMASPSLVRDPRRCPKPPAPLVAGGWSNYGPLAEMGALYIGRGTGGAGLSSTGQAFLAANPGLAPDRLRLYGNYQTAEQFPTRAIAGPGATVIIQLQPDSGALLRLGYNIADPNRNTILTQAFPAGRALRLISPEGEEQYSIIAGATSDGAGVPQLTVQHAALALQYQGTQPLCGIKGAGTGYLVNVVNIVEYALDDTLVATDPNYQDLKAGGTTETWARTDLVRSEIDPQTGNVIAGSQQLVAEYAVDIRFGITAVTVPLTGVMTTFPAGSPLMDPFTTAAAAPLVNSGPHLIRGVRAQLSVRSRAPDRGADIPVSLRANPTDLFRVALPGGGDTFARVRTLATTVATRNTRGVTWP